MTSKSLSTDMENSCRHIAPSDDAFTARMRFHQSWYRHHVLDLPPGPDPAARGALYGNMLRPEDGQDGWNFLSGDIHAWVEARLQHDSTGLEAGRLRNNLLSSQPMCFNLFAPPALDLDLATTLVRSLPGLPTTLRVTRVICEYAPDKATHLQDNSAFDAWIEYALPDGSLGFVGIETKLTEPFSQKSYAYDDRYRRWQSDPNWWWRDGAETAFEHKQINQLWRNHLLAFAMLHQPDPVYQQGFCAVLYHDEDQSCVKAIEAYKRHLHAHADATLLAWPLSQVLACWAGLLHDRALRQWIKALRLRYLDLDASEPTWNLYQQC